MSNSLWSGLMIVFLSMMVTSTISSQSRDSEEDSTEEEVNDDVSMIEGTLEFISPFSRFGNVLDRKLLGISFSYYNQTKSELYSFFGFQVQYSRFGGLSNDVNTGFDSFNEDTRTNYLAGKFLFRQYAPFYLKAVEPFMEVSLGPHLVYTVTNTTFFDEDASTDVNFEESDFGLSYGLSVGATIGLVDNFFIVLKSGFHSSTASTVLVPAKELEFDFPIDNFRPLTTQMNYFDIEIGVAYAF